MGAGTRVLWGVGALAFALVGVEFGVHVFLNVSLPLLLSARPHRFQLDHDVAWMVRPGEVHVRGLVVRNQGPMDQWFLAVDEATLWFDAGALGDHTIRISGAEASGASFWWRARAGIPHAGAYADATPPIPGLTNPPDPKPEDRYPMAADPWRVKLEDVRVSGVREIWMEDLRFTGDATVAGSLEVEARTWLEARSVALSITDGQVRRGDAPVLTNVRGEGVFDYAGTDPQETLGKLRLGSISGDLVLHANTRDLGFLDFYLRKVPWVRFSKGLGGLAVDVRIEDGTFVNGSSATVDVTQFEAQILSYTVVGDGQVLVAVDAPDGAVQTSLRVEFKDYVVGMNPKAPPHVKGTGLVLTATTPDVAIDQPFTSLQIAIDVPEAQILDVTAYNAYLPHGIGLSLDEGTGTLRGRLAASTLDGDCDAEVFLEGRSVTLDVDQVAMLGDVTVHGLVEQGNLITGIFDISGSSIVLNGLQVRSGDSNNPDRDDSDGWWARASVPSGNVFEGAPIFLKGNVAVACRDTVPIITLFSERNLLPGWVRGLLTTGPVQGSAHVTMGENLLRVSDLDLSAGNFQVLAEIRRRNQTAGKLYVRFGTLSLGMGIAQPKNKLYFLNSRKWYDAEPAPN